MTLYALDSLGAEESISHASYYKSFLKGVTKPNNASLGNVSLQVLAAQTGGLVLNSNDLTALLTRAVKDLDAYYESSFTPKPGDNPNEYHQISDQVAKPGFTARTLQGYYSQP
jgi:hypothetical protein